MCRSSELGGVTLTEAAKLVKEKGTDFSSTQIKVLNMTGKISMSFGTDTPLEPGTNILFSFISICLFRKCQGSQEH